MKRKRRCKKKGISLLLIMTVMMSFCVTFPITVLAEEDINVEENTLEDKTEEETAEETEAINQTQKAPGEEDKKEQTEVITTYNLNASAEGMMAGIGTPEKPYQISTLEELKTFRNIVNGTLTETEMGLGYTENAGACAELTADIDLGGKENGNWEPIGKDVSSDGYMGTFDGNNHKIMKLYYHSLANDYAGKGLFGKIALMGQVKNLHISEDSSMYWWYMAGGLCAVNNGLIENCSSSGRVEVPNKRGAMRIGGLVGQNGGLIKGCYYLGTIEISANMETTYIGGIAGTNSGTIQDSYNDGKINAMGCFGVGGISGKNDKNIKNCINLGAVCGNGKVGGITGELSGTIENSYNTAPVTMEASITQNDTGVGGIAGYSGKVSTNTKNCYNAGPIVMTVNEGVTVTDAGAGGICGRFKGGNFTNTYYLEQTAEKGIGSSSLQTIPTTTPLKLDEMTGANALTNMNLNASGWYATPNTVSDETDASGNYTINQYFPGLTVFNGKIEPPMQQGTVPPVIITVTGQDEKGGSVAADLTGGGSYKPYSEVTLKAPAVPGYNFMGWYNSKDAVNPAATELTYTFAAGQSSDSFTARYQALGKVAVSIDGGGKKYTVNDTEHTEKLTSEYPLGSSIQVAASDTGSFSYWKNKYGMKLSTSASYTFTVTGPTEITAVYKTAEQEGKAIVVFESDYGQIIQQNQVNQEEAANLTPPAGPVKLGYEFVDWDKTAEAISNEIQNSQTLVIVKPKYTLQEDSYKINVTNGQGTGSYKNNDRVTVAADPASAGQKFSHWEDENKKVLSYSETYEFFATKDCTVTAVYVAESERVEPVGTGTIVNVVKNTENKTISFVSMLTVPQGCIMETAGIIATTDAGIAGTDNFNSSTAAIVRGDSWKGTAYQYTWTALVNENTVVYVRPYLVYKDRIGNVKTVYGDIVSDSLSTQNQ